MAEELIIDIGNANGDGDGQEGEKTRLSRANTSMGWAQLVEEDPDFANPELIEDVQQQQEEEEEDDDEEEEDPIEEEPQRRILVNSRGIEKPLKFNTGIGFKRFKRSTGGNETATERVGNQTFQFGSGSTGRHNPPFHFSQGSHFYNQDQLNCDITSAEENAKLATENHLLQEEIDREREELVKCHNTELELEGRIVCMEKRLELLKRHNNEGDGKNPQQMETN